MVVSCYVQVARKKVVIFPTRHSIWRIDVLLNVTLVRQSRSLKQHSLVAKRNKVSDRKSGEQEEPSSTHIKQCFVGKLISILGEKTSVYYVHCVELQSSCLIVILATRIHSVNTLRIAVHCHHPSFDLDRFGVDLFIIAVRFYEE